MTTNAEPSSVPEWLRLSRSSLHITTVLRTLAQREQIRASARSASRHKSDPSLAHRLSHLGALVTHKSEHVDHYSISASVHPDNQRANRYADVGSYDRTRITVPRGIVEDGDSSPSDGRYLNGNWVRELFGGKWWIATQAPLPHTAHAFLSVILQPVTRPPDTLHNLPGAESNTSRVRTVVQLTRNIESGMLKAHVYFPPLEGQSWVMSPEPGCAATSIKVTLLKITSIDEAHCVQSTVSVQPVLPQDVEPVVFQHMLYGSWPDHGVPNEEDRIGLLRFTRLVDQTNRDLSWEPESLRNELDPDPPIMVNCSAGIGRTGAFIAVSSLLRAQGLLSPVTSLSSGEMSTPPPLPPSPLGPLPEELHEDLVAQEIDSLREQRPGMVQKDEQILFVYEMLTEAFSALK
ncbi:predicted protein [Sparassis crispa]|uniref:Phosphatases II n=1 Tax=Sparassis crispa TaxID=139825 RepID=A0A401G501_9APHY|nr:predicted protein [Sparassis crispa]GBE77244.1 predicted protein [Sparassis crispa]